MLSSCGTQKKTVDSEKSGSSSPGKKIPPHEESTGASSNNSSSRMRFYQQKYEKALGTTSSLNSLALYEFIDDWMNAPYKYGGNSKSGVDCSRLSIILMKEVYDKTISGGSADIFKQTQPISKKELKEGDLVFFKINTTSISHMGVYLVNHKFIHSTTHAGVVISDLNDEYYSWYFFAAARMR